MKLTIRKEQLNETPETFLHHSGWGLIHDRRRGVSSFVKRLGSGHYPRLHLYVDERDGLVIFNMHMDQKETSYEGSHMHNAEYDNELVEAEIDSIKMSLGISSGSDMAYNQPPTSAPKESSASVSVSKPQYNQGNFADDLAALKAEKPRTFWQKLLGL
ncbi:MAG: hypothetical protein WCJ57_02045 [Candidatus Falkowbacteria bacterium]